MYSVWRLIHIFAEAHLTLHPKQRATANFHSVQMSSQTNHSYLIAGMTAKERYYGILVIRHQGNLSEMSMKCYELNQECTKISNIHLNNLQEPLAFLIC